MEDYYFSKNVASFWTKKLTVFTELPRRCRRCVQWGLWSCKPWPGSPLSRPGWPHRPPWRSPRGGSVQWSGQKEHLRSVKNYSQQTTQNSLIVAVLTTENIVYLTNWSLSWCFVNSVPVVQLSVMKWPTSSSQNGQLSLYDQNTSL